MVVSTFIPPKKRKTELMRQEICFEDSREKLMLQTHSLTPESLIRMSDEECTKDNALEDTP